MLPVHLADNIRKQVLYYLQSTFSFRDKRVARAFESFLEDPEMGLFKGPWVQLRRPFRPAPEGAFIPFEIHGSFSAIPASVARLDASLQLESAATVDHYYDRHGIRQNRMLLIPCSRPLPTG